MGTQEQRRGGAWTHGTQAPGCADFILTPFKLNMNCGPWKTCVIIFQAANMLDGAQGGWPSPHLLILACCSRPRTPMPTPASGRCPASSGLLQDNPLLTHTRLTDPSLKLCFPPLRVHTGCAHCGQACIRDLTLKTGVVSSRLPHIGDPLHSKSACNLVNKS